MGHVHCKSLQSPRGPRSTSSTSINNQVKIINQSTHCINEPHLHEFRNRNMRYGDFLSILRIAIYNLDKLRPFAKELA